MSSEAPADRCGYTQDVSTLQDVGGTCCWRPVWEDHDRCLWHVEVANKPAELFEEYDAHAGERIDGAYLRGVPAGTTDCFADVDLNHADFENAVLRGAAFAKSNLRWADFSGADLVEAVFTEARLQGATFVGADLRDADFENARIYRTNFADARVDHETDFGDEVVYERWLDGSRGDVERTDIFDEIVWSYRELQQLFEDNAIRDRRRHYYIKEMDVRRRVAWRRGNRVRALLLEGSRAVMGYGTSPWRVMGFSAVAIVVAAMLYPVVGGFQDTGTGQAITYQIDDPTVPPWWLGVVFLKSLYFSATTFATLGFGDIRPVGPVTRAIAAVEALLGALLLAVLVYVLMRRVQ